MRTFTSLLIFFCFSIPVFCQAPQWANYINDYVINDIALEGDLLWVGSQGGLTKINRLTGEKQSFIPSNSGIKGFGVSSIYVAPDGVKWIGGERGGLMRFDGTNWEQFYYINTGDTLIQVSTIKSAPNGDLWLRSTINGNCGGCSRFIKFDGSTFTRMDEVFGTINPSNGAGPVIAFDIDLNGDIWVLTNTNIQHFDGTSVVENYPLSAFGFLSNENAKKLIIGANNTPLLVSSKSNTSRVWQLNGGQWDVMPVNGNDFTNGDFQYVELDAAGNLWINSQNTSSGVSDSYYKYDGVSWQVWMAADLPNMPAAQPNGEPDLMYVDAEGNWWFKHYTLGGIHAPKVFEFDGVNWKGYDTEIFPLGGNYVKDVAFDCEGNTWFGGSFLTRFDGVNWTDFTPADIGINGVSFSINSITLDTNTCDLWIAFKDGTSNNVGFTKYDGNTFINYYTPSEDDASKVLIDSSGEIWVASPNNGLGHFDGNNWTWFDEFNSPLYTHIYDIVLDHQGRLWASCYGQGISVYDGGTWTTYNSTNSPVQNFNTWLLVDESGNIWTRNEGAPLRFDGTNWISLPVTTGYGGVFSMAQELDGTMWFGAYFSVYGYNGNDFTEYKIETSDIGGSLTWAIKIDAYGNKWFVHNTGVTVFNESGISNRLINPPNSVTGTVFFDTNQDGSHASIGEPGLPGQQIILQPENLTTYSSFGGYYKLHPQPGSHQLSFQPDAPYVPTTASALDLLMGNGDQTGFDFGAWTANPPDSIGLDITAGLARCSQTTTVWVQVTNFSLLDAAGTVTLNVDPLLGFESADPAPTSINGNTLTWDFSGLSPYEYDPIKVVFQTPNADFVGEWLDFTATAVASGSGQSISDVASTEIRCSFDPNEKQATPTGESVSQYSLLGDALDYTIFFQNKGNDTAFIVIIRDTLDNDLDATSFQLLASSHPVRVERQGAVLSFFFENINLPWEASDEPGSHGFAKYRIRPNTGLPDPTDIQNTAHIYFDFNPAIVTNTTANTLVETLPFLATDEPVVRPTILISPNPNHGSFWLETSDEGPWTATVSDLSGRVVRRLSALGKKTEVEGLSAGFYIVTIKQDGHVSNGKVVVEKAD